MDEPTIGSPKRTVGTSKTIRFHPCESRKRAKLAQNANQMIGANRQETDARHTGIASITGKWPSVAAERELGGPSATAPIASMKAAMRALGCRPERLKKRKIANDNKIKRTRSNASALSNCALSQA